MSEKPPITYDKPIWRQLDPEAAGAYDALSEEQRQKLNDAAAKELETSVFDVLDPDFFGDEVDDGGGDENAFQCAECGDHDQFSLKTCEVCDRLVCPTCRSPSHFRVLCNGCDPDYLDPYSDDY